MPIQRSAAAIQDEIDQAERKVERIQHQMATLGERADQAGADTTAGYEEKVDRLVTGFDKAKEHLVELRAEMRRAVQREDQLEAVRSGASRGYTEPGDGSEIRRTGFAGRGSSRVYSEEGQAIRSRALKTLDRLALKDEIGRSVLSNAAIGDAIDALIRRDDKKVDGSYIARRLLLTESDAYRSAFMKYIRADGRQIYLTVEENDAVAALNELEMSRAMAENTTTTGGFGVPALVDSTIILTSGAADVPILQYCRIEQVTNNLWSGVSSAGMVWSYTTEGTEASDNSPTLAQPTVRIHTAKGFIPYSVEVAQDYPDFAAQMGELLNQGYQDLLASKTMTGSGTGEPFGLFTSLDATTTSEIVTTTDGSFGGPDIFKIFNALPERFRGRSAWVMSETVRSAIRQFAASQSSTSAYFTIDLTGGVFRINDRPVIVTDYAPTFSGSVPGTTGAANILACGDWRTAYVFAQRAGMSVETIPMLTGSGSRFPTGQRGLWAWARNGANVVASNGARLLQNQ